MKSQNCWASQMKSQAKVDVISRCPATVLCLACAVTLVGSDPSTAQGMNQRFKEEFKKHSYTQSRQRTGAARSSSKYAKRPASDAANVPIIVDNTLHAT